MKIKRSVKVSPQTIVKELKELNDGKREQLSKKTLQAALAYFENESSLPRISKNHPLKLEEILSTEKPEPIAAEEKNSEFVRTKDVADYYGVSQQTVRDWIKTKQFPAVQLQKHGNWKIRREAFEFMKRKQAEPHLLHDRIMERLKEEFPDADENDLIGYEIEMDEGEE